MKVWKIMIRRAPDEADRRQGYAFAQTEGEALELAKDPNAVAVVTAQLWPGRPGERVCWLN